MDFDVHHCNGTQKIFHKSNNVLVFSTFCSDLGYPLPEETLANDIGEDEGLGYNVNVPLILGFGDGDLLAVYDDLLIPLMKSFKPKAIVVSAGFDAVAGDPLGHCNVSKKCFAALVDKVTKAGDGNIVLALEGGYDPPVLAECAAYVVRALLGEDVIQEKHDPPKPETVATILQLKGLLSETWDVFK